MVARLPLIGGLGETGASRRRNRSPVFAGIQRLCSCGSVGTTVAVARAGAVYSQRGSGRRLLSLSQVDAQGVGLPQSLNAVPRPFFRMGSKSGAGAWRGPDAANQGHFLPSRSPGSLFFEGGQGTSQQDARASSRLDDYLEADESSRAVISKLPPPHLAAHVREWDERRVEVAGCSGPERDAHLGQGNMSVRPSRGRETGGGSDPRTDRALITVELV